MSRENTLRANERLRDERLRRGWSQQKLADELGIAVVTVNRWERGKQQPTGYYRLKLSTLFDKSAEELGLVEETIGPDALSYNEELQESIGETTSTSQITPEDATEDPLPPLNKVPSTPLLEKETSRLSLSSSYAQLGIPLLYRRGRTMRLFILLALLIVVVLITFSVVRLNSMKSSTTSKLPAQIVPTHSLPTQNPGKLVLNDPLTKAGGDSEWQVGGPVCEFTKNGLQMNSPGQNYCSANIRNFDNMVFKVDMSLQQGKWAGVTFRADDQGNMYYFSISTSGQYELDVFKPSVQHPFILFTGSSSAIYVGYNKWNVIMVEANKSHLSFWVNKTMIKEKDDTTRTDGYIGSCVGTYNLSADPSASDTRTIATFRNAYVWQI